MGIRLRLSWWDDIRAPVVSWLSLNFSKWPELGAVNLLPATRAAIWTVFVARTVFRTLNCFPVTTIMANRIAIAITNALVVFVVAMVVALENFVLPLIATRSWWREDGGTEVGKVFIQRDTRATLGTVFVTRTLSDASGIVVIALVSTVDIIFWALMNALLCDARTVIAACANFFFPQDHTLRIVWLVNVNTITAGLLGCCTVIWAIAWATVHTIRVARTVFVAQ